MTQSRTLQTKTPGTGILSNEKSDCQLTASPCLCFQSSYRDTFPVQATPSSRCAVGDLGIVIYTESGAFLPGFQAPYHPFTIWHGHSAAWPKCQWCAHFFFDMTWKSRNLWQREILKILLFCSSKICNHKWTWCPRKLSKVDSVCSNAAQCHAAPAMDVIEYQRLEGYLRAAPNTRLKNPVWVLVSCQFKRPATYHTTKGKVSAFFSCGSALL